jgi:lysophospholipase L1-like esterase
MHKFDARELLDDGPVAVPPPSAMCSMSPSVGPLRAPLRALVAILGVAWTIGGCGSTIQSAPGSLADVGASPSAASSVLRSPTYAASSASTPADSPSRPQWKYVAFGDSVSSGEGDVQGASFVVLLGKLIERETSVRVSTTNLASVVGTTQTLLDALEHDATFQDALADADVITIEIGVNDVESGLGQYASKTCGGADNLACFRTGLADFKGRWDAILVEIVKARPPTRSAIRVLTDYDGFAGNAVAAANLGPNIERDIAPFLDQLNDYRCSTAAKYKIPCVDIARAFNGPSRHAASDGLIGSDGIHPSADGHRLIAETINAVGYAPLR